jgi:WhiB family redox-sensing transcriptional regulator
MMWMDDAACREVDPELFFPDGAPKDVVQQAQQAKAVCQRCLVARECLTWAIDTDQVNGIWGGQNLRERRRQKRRLVAVEQRRQAA